MARATGSGAKRAAPAKKIRAKTTATKAPVKRGRSNAKVAGKGKAAPAEATTKRSAVKKAGSKTPGSPRTVGKRTTSKKAATATKRGAPRPKSPFSAKFLAAQEKVLREQRLTYTRQAKSLRDEADSLVADFEPGDVQFDEESGEGDTISIERERDLALSAQAQSAVDEIDVALAKIERGTYGICEVSGEPIPAERLEAIPWARVRVEHKIGGIGRR